MFCKTVLDKFAKESTPVNISLKMANRHGLISGATGSGKTISARRLAECFSESGIPVLLSDVKGDLRGFSSKNDKLTASSVKSLDKSWKSRKFPTQEWDIFGKTGKSLSTTVEDFGQKSMCKALGLNTTQSGVVNIMFEICQDLGITLNTIEDVKVVLGYMTRNSDSLSEKYGNITKPTLGVIQRELLQLSRMGGDSFFGGNTQVSNFLKVKNNQGVINVIDAKHLSENPKLYASVVIWILEKLYKELPEVGDCEKPKLALMIDEAHMLFDGISKELLSKVESIVRLIRSKGVGVFFITQSPSDIPDGILSQLGNKIIHRLSPFSTKEVSMLRMIGNIMKNDFFDTAEEILSLPIGHAIVSFVGESGGNSNAQKVVVVPPKSKF